MTDPMYDNQQQLPVPNLLSVPQASGPYAHSCHAQPFTKYSGYKYQDQSQCGPPPQPAVYPTNNPMYCPLPPPQPFTFSNVLVGNQPIKGNQIQLSLPNIGCNTNIFSPRSNRSSSPETPTECTNNSMTNELNVMSQSNSLSFIQPTPQRQKLSIVLFDWDDTLYPTTCIINKKENVTASELSTFGKLLYDMFAEYIKVYGGNNIYIITNSSKNWTLKSLKICSKIYQKKMRIRSERASRHAKIAKIGKSDNKQSGVDYFALVHDSLVSLSIRIISAQYLYAQQYPHKPSIWKIKAFKQITIEHFKNIKGVSNGDNIIYEIVSIGDSENEYIASFEAKYKLNKFIKRRKSRNNIIRLHRIKLTKEPKINVMIKQLRLLIDEAILMHCEPGSVTIRYQ